jgi:hypothetical protein
MTVALKRLERPGSLVQALKGGRRGDPVATRHQNKKAASWGGFQKIHI